MRFVMSNRVSTDDQSERGTGLKTQLLDNRQAVERFGGEIVAIETDDGISGRIPPGPDRPGIERALRMLETGQAEALIAYNASRLARKMSVALGIWERIQEAGARLFLADLGEVTEANELMYALSSGFAQQEWREIRKRTMSGKRRQAEAERMPVRTYAPFGYRLIKNSDPDAARVVKKRIGGQECTEVVTEEGRTKIPGTYEIIEREARWVREIFTRYAAGATLQEVCRWLQDEGVTPPKPKRCKQGEAGAQWIPSTVKRILNSTLYYGEARWGQTERVSRQGKKRQKKTALEQQIVIPAPAIVDKALWQACQDRLASNRGRTQRQTSRKLFTGLVRCPVCRRSTCARAVPYYWQKDGQKLKGASVYYHCKDSCPCSNALRKVCHNRYYRERLIVDAFAPVIDRLEQDPVFVAATLESHLREQGQAVSETDLQAVCRELEALTAKEDALADAQIEAKIAGRDASVYVRKLDAAKEDRKRLEARKRALEEVLAETRSINPLDAAEVAATVAADLREVLTSEDYEAWEKNAVFTRFLSEIVPTAEGFSFAFHPFEAGSTVSLIAFVSTETVCMMKMNSSSACEKA